MMYRARRFLNYALFNRRCRGVLDTKRLEPVANGPIVVSMVNGRDFIPYLIAAKSFHAQLRAVRFHIVDDGSLTSEQRRQLRTHLGATITHIGTIAMGPTPRGGTWERLLL